MLKFKKIHRLNIIFVSFSLFIFFNIRCIAVWDALSGVSVEDIQKRGTLKVITAYGANSYFIYRGTPMGYEYELLKLLAKDLGVKLELIVTRDLDNIVYMLNSNKGDLIAANIVMTLERAKEVSFTQQLTQTRQVLVQRSFGSGKDFKIIRNPIELIGKKVYVRKRSVFYHRLRNLEEEIGGKIDIATVAGNVPTEELIRRVYLGKIDYTIADEPTALINKAYYRNIDVSTYVSFPQGIAWVVRRNSPRLRAALNKWILKIQNNGSLASIYNKYYKNPRAFTAMVTSKYYSLTGGKLSVFDTYIKTEAEVLGWDWRLLASQIYQESRFNPKARSWAGAQGLMQLMPKTAKLYGLNNPYDPVSNIKGGVRYIKEISKKFANIKDENERIKFILAAYNAGPGHVEDAQILAEKNGDDPNLWTDNTEKYILKLSFPEYYNLPYIKYGYCRGEEPYNYVRKILERYEQYKKLIK